MKLLLVLFGSLQLAYGQSNPDVDWSACHRADALDVITGDSNLCPADTRGDWVKKALSCRCGYDVTVVDPNVCTTQGAAIKECFCSNRTRDSDGNALFVAGSGYEVQRCPPKPECPAVEECVVPDFYDVLQGQVAASFAALMDQLPGPWKTALETKASNLAFLKDSYTNMQRADFVRALTVIRSLTRFERKARKFMKDTDGCFPCYFPKCFLGKGLSMIRHCDEDADEVPFEQTEMLYLAMGSIGMTPKCILKPSQDRCARPPLCTTDQEPIMNLETGCPECRHPKQNHCPHRIFRDIAECAPDVDPVKQQDGCPSCRLPKQVDECERGSRNSADLPLCDFGERPQKDGCFWTCRKPTRKEKKERCGSDAGVELVQECTANYDLLRDCEADEDPKKDWDRCCMTCKRTVPDLPVDGVCTDQEIQDCIDNAPLCDPTDDLVYCDPDTAADFLTPECRFRDPANFCCDECTDIDTVRPPIETAECLLDLPECLEDEEPMIDEDTQCITCREVNPCMEPEILADGTTGDLPCFDGCHPEWDDASATRVAVCDERVGEIGFDIEAAVDVLRTLIQMPLPIIKMFAVTMMKHYCNQQSHKKRCKEVGMKVINSVEAKILQFVAADGTLTDFGNGMTAADALGLLPTSTIAGTTSIHLSLQFSIEVTAGNRRLLQTLADDETAEGQFLKDAVTAGAEAGDDSITVVTTGVVERAPTRSPISNNNIDDLEEPSAGTTSTAAVLTSALTVLMAVWTNSA